MDKIAASLEKIATFCDYVIHPAKILLAFWKFIVSASLPVCTVIAIICIILFAMGYKKYGKGATLSFVAYVAIQALNTLV